MTVHTIFPASDEGVRCVSETGRGRTEENG